MGQLLGIRLSHYPGLSRTDEAMSAMLAANLKRLDVPADRKDPANWPDGMRAEWSDPAAAAAKHRRTLVANLDRLRQTLDAFEPDALVIWGDDQYENFNLDPIPLN